jgi:cytochrome bd-type quinol oxidase subunit 2
MIRRVRNNMLVVSLSLGAAGILACMGALFDSLVAEGSIFGFLAATVPLGLAIVGILMGFAWLCDKCESYLSRRARRLAARRRLPTTVKSAYGVISVTKKWHGQ